MMIMPHGRLFLGVYALPQRGLIQRSFQIMGRKGVARQQAVHIALAHQRRKRPARIGIKDHRRPAHPQNIALLPVMAQYVVQGVIVYGKRGLAAGGCAKGKGLPAAGGRRFGKPGRMYQNPVLTVLAAPHRHRIPGFQPPELHHLSHIPPPAYHAIHTRVAQQHPVTGCHVHVFREYGGGMKIRRGHAVRRAGHKARRGRVRKRGRRKIRVAEGGQGKLRHDKPPCDDKRSPHRHPTMPTHLPQETGRVSHCTPCHFRLFSRAGNLTCRTCRLPRLSAMLHGGPKGNFILSPSGATARIHE